MPRFTGPTADLYARALRHMIATFPLLGEREQVNQITLVAEIFNVNGPDLARDLGWRSPDVIAPSRSAPTSR